MRIRQRPQAPGRYVVRSVMASSRSPTPRPRPPSLPVQWQASPAQPLNTSLRWTTPAQTPGTMDLAPSHRWGAFLGVGGCILGSCMPYRHPVAVALSVLWWGIYLGCFGASVGALLGMWAEPTPAPPSP